MIIYPSEITTTKDKLHAHYYTLEQMRLEYNRVCDKDAKKNPGKWLTYKKEFESKESVLLLEMLKLRALAIKNAGISVKDINRYNFRDVLDPILGKRHELKSLPVDITCSELDELKAIDFDKLTDTKDYDPLEDFTSGYSETDPSSKLTVTANQVAFSAIARGSGCYVTKDFGASHFTTFEHKYSLLVSAQTVSNDSEFDAYDLYDATSEKCIILYYQNSGTNETDCVLVGVDPDFVNDYVANLAVGTRYYNVLKRDASAITLKVYTGSDYSTGLVDTLTIDKGDSTALQYAYIMKATDGSGGSSTGAFNDLDLQEAAPPSGSCATVVSTHMARMRRN